MKEKIIGVQIGEINLKVNSSEWMRTLAETSLMIISAG